MSDLQSIHTNTFSQLLQHLGISLVVSTYQAGKLIIIRDDSGVVNTHFRNFTKPMGIAVSQGKIALGTGYQIIELHNVPTVTNRLNPPDKHDACYLPRFVHFTGDIDIHEMTYLNNKELWFINTGFSCLCSLDTDYSFVPRWRPPFVSAYDTGDRCHLNGLGIRDEQVRYITALGTTDTSGGWRPQKHNGGILMDITTNEFICQGLSMPHSPRWYRNGLWVLESGDGSIAQVDLNTGNLTTITNLPGFTRGIDFWGNYAFIGLSKVRESAVFSGIPITERLTERICGVWVVNVVTGEVVAYLRFTTGVEEIFAVQVLPHKFPEVINDHEDILRSSYVIPNEALAEVAKVTPEDLLAAKQREIEQNAVKSFVVVVPVYNISKKGKKVIKRTLDSIDKSINYFQFNHPQVDSFTYEVIIVDDNSNDDTEKIIKSLIKHKSYYRYLRHQENKGQAIARNTGVNASLGEAIFFCDDDDLFYPEHISKCLTLINQPLGDDCNALVRIRGNYPAAVKTGVKTK